MAFNTYGTTTSAGAEKKTDINWSELNNYVIETAQLQERETLVGYISAIVDLGIQNQDDAEYVSDVDPDEEDTYIDEHPGTYFKDGLDPEKKTPCRLKCVPMKPQQSIGIAIDFPDIMIDKGQFFGESNPKPLRLWMGNQFYLQSAGAMVIGRPTPLRVTNLDKTRKTKKWSFAQNHVCYKMAVAAKLIKAGECFLPNDIDKLLGQAFQFTAQVYNKEGKGGASYYTEYVNFVGALGRGQTAPELVTEPILIQFNEKNKPEHLKELRSHVINTMKMAKNWEGSIIQKQLEGIKNASGSDNEAEDESTHPQEEKKPSKAKETPKKASKPVFDDLDDDIPF